MYLSLWSVKSTNLIKHGKENNIECHVIPHDFDQIKYSSKFTLNYGINKYNMKIKGYIISITGVVIMF